MACGSPVPALHSVLAAVRAQPRRPGGVGAVLLFDCRFPLEGTLDLCWLALGRGSRVTLAVAFALLTASDWSGAWCVPVARAAMGPWCVVVLLPEMARCRSKRHNTTRIGAGVARWGTHVRLREVLGRCVLRGSLRVTADRCASEGAHTPIALPPFVAVVDWRRGHSKACTTKRANRRCGNLSGHEKWAALVGSWGSLRRGGGRGCSWPWRAQ